MKQPATFAEILEEKMNSTEPTASENAPSPSSPPTFEIGVDNFGFKLNFSFGAQARRNATSYFASEKPAVASTDRPKADQPVKAKRMRQEVHVAITELNTPAQLALDALKITGPSVSLSQVKKTFRRLAIQMHPDTQSTVGRRYSRDEFQGIQDAYDILVKEIERLAKSRADESASSKPIAA